MSKYSPEGFFLSLCCFYEYCWLNCIMLGWYHGFLQLNTILLNNSGLKFTLTVKISNKLQIWSGFCYVPILCLNESWSSGCSIWQIASETTTWIKSTQAFLSQNEPWPLRKALLSRLDNAISHCSWEELGKEFRYLPISNSFLMGIKNCFTCYCYLFRKHFLILAILSPNSPNF